MILVDAIYINSFGGKTILELFQIKPYFPLQKKILG